MSEKPLHRGPMRESIGCDNENFSSPKESRLRAIRGGSPTAMSEAPPIEGRMGGVSLFRALLLIGGALTLIG